MRKKGSKESERRGKRRTLGARGESTISPLAVGDIVLVGLNTGEESFERGSASAVLAINGLLSLGRDGSAFTVAAAKQRVGKVVSGDAASGLKVRKERRGEGGVSLFSYFLTSMPLLQRFSKGNVQKRP